MKKEIIANNPRDEFLSAPHSFSASQIIEILDVESEVGLSKEEALATLEDFVDRSLMNSSSQLRILHGKGNGILRLAVRQKLREYGRSLSNIHHPPPEAGGDGVTLVDLN